MTTMHDHRQTETPRISLEAAATVLLRGEALFVDVRSPEEYRSSHVTGAVNVALQELPQRLQGLPKERPIVTYCT
jgi:hydroxyacylglutathione hydrolase